MTDVGSIDEQCINTIRTLAIDAINKANSGHPGAPMALAPAAYALWTRVMRYNPKNPTWFDRDRFVLSNGHASMLLYAILHLTGFDLSIEEIKNFRQWGSMTPGHPEFGDTPGVETTTGPLGQGLMNAVGMAIAEAHLAAVYNRENYEIVDHHTYAFCGDGDLMEGASHEAASLAGHLGLGKLICLYDDNHISIEGVTEITYTDNVQKRFESYDWHVINLAEKANDLNAITRAFEEAKAAREKPSMIILRTHIGFGSPNKVDTPGVHGNPLGADEAILTKKAYGWPTDTEFMVPQEVREHLAPIAERGQEQENAWLDKFTRYEQDYPDLARRFKDGLDGDYTKKWQGKQMSFSPDDGPVATRATSGKVINSFAEKLEWLMGGSADLEPSTKTGIKCSSYFSRTDPKGRNIAYGVREHVMCAAASGLALHGGVRPFVATFFVFTDYARPAIRLAALMRLPVIYIMTHDSIGVGEDGPTHQPIEHLGSLRMVPNLTLIRPCDANETVYAWQAALENRGGPTMLALTRQGLPILDRSSFGPADGVLRGAYILRKEKGNAPDIILIASGSEVQLVLGAGEKLAEQGADVRVVSMPSWELFQNQPENYQEHVLPPSCKKRLAVEAGATFGWQRWIGDHGLAIGIESFRRKRTGK